MAASIRLDLTAVKIYLFSTLFLLVIPFGHCNIVSVDQDELKNTVANNELTLVLVYKDNCAACETGFNVVQEALKSDIVPPGLKFVKSKDVKVAEAYGVKEFPALLYFRHAFPIIHEETSFVADELAYWLFKEKEVSIHAMSDANFEHLTQAATGATTGHWFVLFYEPECEEFLPLWEAFAAKIKHKMSAAIVDTSSSPDTKERFNVTRCPSTIFFRLGKMYLYNFQDTATVSTLVNFVESLYKHIPAKKVPPVKTAFDKLTDKIVFKLKEYMHDDTTRVNMALALIMVLTSLVLLICWIKGRRKISEKED